MSHVQPRETIRSIAAVHHGAFDYAELEALGLQPEELIDFSVNSNPFGPSPAVREAIQRVEVDVYPDREALDLRRMLAARWQVSPDWIVAGSGTSELLLLVALAFIHPGDTVLILPPTYGEYAHAARIAGGEIHSLRAGAGRDFRHDLQQVDETLTELRPRAVFLCSPNNPTGAVIPPAAIRELAGRHPETLFIVDEAYRRFVPGLASTFSPDVENLLALVSMTKDYALAGLRLGYAVGSPRFIRAIAGVRPPWNVNAAALAAGQAALADQAYLEDTIGRLRQAHADLHRGLADLGYKLTPTETHYGLLKVGDGAGFRSRLLRTGILVRDCASFGLPAYVRIAARRPEENDRLLDALRELSR